MARDKREIRIRLAEGKIAMRIDPRTFPPDREGVAEWARAMRAMVAGAAPDPAAPLVALTTQCGRLYEFDAEEDVPVFDLPCGCDDPECWVVKWEEIPDGA